MCELRCFGLSTTRYGQILTIDRRPVTVDRVVVVQRAVRVHVAHVVAVARVRRAEPAVTSGTANRIDSDYPMFPLAF